MACISGNVKQHDEEDQNWLRIRSDIVPSEMMQSALRADLGHSSSLTNDEIGGMRRSAVVRPQGHFDVSTAQNQDERQPVLDGTARSLHHQEVEMKVAEVAECGGNVPEPFNHCKWKRDEAAGNWTCRAGEEAMPAGETTESVYTSPEATKTDASDEDAKVQLGGQGLTRVLSVMDKIFTLPRQSGQHPRDEDLQKKKASPAAATNTQRRALSATQEMCALKSTQVAKEEGRPSLRQQRRVPAKMVVTEYHLSYGLDDSEDALALMVEDAGLGVSRKPWEMAMARRKSPSCGTRVSERCQPRDCSRPWH